MLVGVFIELEHPDNIVSGSHQNIKNGVKAGTN